VAALKRLSAITNT